MRRGFLGLAGLTLLLVSLAGPAFGQQPIVRMSVTPEAVPVGEPVALQITVLVPTWFPKPLGYPDFELTNTITRLPPDSSYPTSERFGRDSWAGIVRTYQIFPLTAAKYHLSGLTVTVTYADPENSKPVTVEVNIPEIEFDARVPVGAEGLHPYVAGRRLTLNREIEGDVEGLKVGDALGARYTAELEGMPVIFLPPLVDVPQAEGVSVYADEPTVDDGSVARRSEKLTFVFEAGGEFTVPSTEIQWWNTETSAVEVASVPAITLSVDGPPVPSLVEEEPPAKAIWPNLLSWGAALFAALWALKRGSPILRLRWVAYQEGRRRSEEYVFKQLQTTLRSGDLPATYNALLHWLEILDPGESTQGFAHRYGDQVLQQQVADLSRSVFDGGDDVSLLVFQKSLVSARHRFLSGRAGSSCSEMPPLNP